MYKDKYMITIDWDRKVGQLKLQKLLLKLNFVVRVSRKPSVHKGFHFEVWGTNKKKLEELRRAYDDPVRYAKDLKRPRHSQNVLFDKKSIIKLPKISKIREIPSIK